MKTSISVKFFAGVIALLTVLTAATLFTGYQGARNAAQEQQKRLSSQTMDSITQFTALRLADIDYFSNAIAGNTSIVELLRENTGDDRAAQLRAEVEQLISDYSWSREYLAIRFDIYILGFNGEKFSTFYRDKYDIHEIEAQPWFQALLSGEEVSAFVGTREDPDGFGPSRYMFQVGRLIYDPATNEPLGTVLLATSEKVLYDCYADAPSGSGTFLMLNEYGGIISAKDKRLLGGAFPENYTAGGTAAGNTVYTAPNGSRYYGISAPIGQTGWTLVNLRGADSTITLGDFITLPLALALAAISVVLVLATKLLTGYLTRPIVALNGKMQQVTAGDLSVRAEVQATDEVGQLSASFNDMVENTEHLIEEIRVVEQMKRRSELDFLRSQINPHFIYNTLDSIRFSVEMGKDEQAQQMLLYFNRLLKHVLDSHHDLLPLRDEVDSIRNYARLQNIRYQGSFVVDYHIDPEVEDVAIPSFILQPIVENAIFYGIDKDRGVTHITITAQKADEATLHLAVRDDGVGMSQQQANDILRKKERMNSIGVSNVNERIKLCCGTQYGLHITSAQGEGTTVLYVLPL